MTDTNLTQTPIDGDLGVIDPEQWERNWNRSQRDGKYACAHCARGIIESTSWSIRYTNDAKVLRADLTDAQCDELSPGWVWLKIGSTCGPRVATKEFRTRTKDLTGITYQEVWQ